VISFLCGRRAEVFAFQCAGQYCQILSGGHTKLCTD
jgi:hypothetical protein